MSQSAKHAVVSGGFEDIRSQDVRFLQEAARLGPLHILLWSDEFLRWKTGRDHDRGIGNPQSLRLPSRVEKINCRQPMTRSCRVGSQPTYEPPREGEARTVWRRVVTGREGLD